MSIDLTRLLLLRFRFRSALLFLLLVVYFIFTFVVFFKAVVPSLDRYTTSEDFAVDSTVYMYMADSLRSGHPEPWVIGSLAFFPNTTWTPVFISWICNSAFVVMLVNYTIFVFSTILLTRIFPISWVTLVCLLLLNPTTTTSILCVNKEILDLLAFSIFLFARKNRNTTLLLIALAIAVLNRYEICIVMLVFLVLNSRSNPLRKKRWLTVLLLVLSLNFIMPTWGAHTLAKRFEEAESAGVIRVLDQLQMHYLYVVAVFPKILDNLFGQIPNPQVWQAPSSWLYLNFFNNVAYAILIVTNVAKRRLSLRNDLIYFCVIGSVLIAQSLVVQPRYFYFVYILLCLQAAQPKAYIPSRIFGPEPYPEVVYA
jgi:hypothetical protein